MTREFNDTTRALYAVADLTACEGITCRRSEASGRPRGLAVAGTRLCSACVLRLTGGLTRLPSLYDECGLLLGGTDRPRERTSGGGGSLRGLPFNTAAAEARSVILGVLRSWAGLVVGERIVAAPRDTVAGVVEFLIRHAGWLAAHEAAGELSEEVARAVRRAGYVVDPPPAEACRSGRASWRTARAG